MSLLHVCMALKGLLASISYILQQYLWYKIISNQYNSFASTCCLCLFQWDEVSVLDDRGKLIRTFEVCNVNQNPRQQDNWLATPFLYRQSAPRMFVTLRFSVRDCASLRTPSPTCRETLTLYYKQADSQRELMRTWVAEVRSKPKMTFPISMEVNLESPALRV